MTSDVYIAGTGGTVIHFDNNELFYRTLNDYETPHPCRAGEVSFMVDCGAEFIRVNIFRGFDFLRSDVELERNKKQALSLSLSGLDSDLTDETRLICVVAAEELASDKRVHLFLKARLLARIVPETADITGGLRCALRGSAVKIGSLYRTMRITQAYIEMVNDAWRKTSISRFDSTEEALIVENGLIDAGVFAEMVEALQHETRKKLETLVVTFSLHPDVKRLHPQIVMILNDMKNAIVRTGCFVDEDREFRLETDDVETDFIDSDPIEELIQNCDQVFRKNIAGHEALAKVDSQILKISEFIRKGDLHRAEYFLYDLVKFNLTTGNKFNLGQSLCNLTKKALVSNALSFAAKLSAYSILLNIDDPVIFCTHAEVFKAKHQYSEALKAYDETIERFADDVIARSGRAEVLKEMGKYPEALKAYDETIERFANDVIARNGRAEILKEMGKYPEALKAYDEIIERFADSVVARSGRAEVLKEMGKYPEALTAYDETIERFADDVIARNGRAEVLKEMGKYPEALKAYDEIIERFADDVVARNGRAEILKEMGKYPEALTAYDETIERFANDRHARNGLANLLILSGRGEEVPPLLNIDNYISKDDWRDYHVVAMSYLRTGNLDEAIQRLEYGLDNVPFLDSKEYFASALAYAKIKKKEYEDIETIFDNLPKTHNQFEAHKRHLFLLHSKAELHKTNEAIDELAQVPAVGNIRLVNLKGFLDKRYCLSGKFIFATTDEYACLDQAIEEEEFILVMTRKAA